MHEPQELAGYKAMLAQGVRGILGLVGLVAGLMFVLIDVGVIIASPEFSQLKLYGIITAACIMGYREIKKRFRY
jgi:hypothetical protein